VTRTPPTPKEPKHKKSDEGEEEDDPKESEVATEPKKNKRQRARELRTRGTHCSFLISSGIKPGNNAPEKGPLSSGTADGLIIFHLAVKRVKSGKDNEESRRGTLVSVNLSTGEEKEEVPQTEDFTEVEGTFIYLVLMLSESEPKLGALTDDKGTRLISMVTCLGSGSKRPDDDLTTVKQSYPPVSRFNVTSVQNPTWFSYTDHDGVKQEFGTLSPEGLDWGVVVPPPSMTPHVSDKKGRRGSAKLILPSSSNTVYLWNQPGDTRGARTC